MSLMPSFLPTNGVNTEIIKTPLHTCKHCSKGFKLEKRKDIHEESCSELTKTMRDNYNDSKPAISLHDLFSIILELKQEVNDLRQELHSKGGFSSRRPIDIVEWLNEQPKLNISFKDYLNNVVVCTRGDLQTLFQTSFVEAVTEIMHKHILEQDESSIRAFTQKDKILYHFNGKEWKAINNEEWECIVGIIMSKLAKVFAEWSNEHITDLENGKQQDEWLVKTKRLHDSSPARFSSIKKRIFNYIKVDIRQYN
jgi:hypothetical protein